MAHTHYYGLIHDAHGRGRRNQLVVDPGSVVPAGQLLQVAAPPSPAAELGVVVRGATSGTAGIIRRIISSTQFVLEAIDNQLLPLPAGGAFAQQNAGPLTGETINFDNGGSSVVAPFGNSQLAPGFDQWLVQENDGKFVDLLPIDASDQPFWDPQAKVAQLIVCTGATGSWRKGDRFTTSAGGAATVLLTSLVGSDLHLRIIRKTGTIEVGNTLTNTTVTGAATIATVHPDPPATGIWVPYCPMPNLRGLGTYYERTPKGNGTDGGGSGVGIETRLMHAIAAHHGSAGNPNDRRFRFIAHSSFDPPEGPTDGILGGVAVQVVKCSGTFPATGTLVAGQTITGPGGWSAVVVGWNVSLKYLYCRKTNGQVLGAGTLTLSGGATVTGTGAALGWQKGSTHWNHWAAQVATAMAATGSDSSPIGGTWPGSTQRWEGMVLMPWETELAVHSTVHQCPFVADNFVREEWIRWTTDIRTQLNRADLPLAVWCHRKESQVTSVPVFPGVGYAFFLRQIIQSLPTSIARLTVFDSETLGAQMGVENDLFLRNVDYRNLLAEAAWRHLQFGQVTIPPGDGFTALPVGILVGQSNATGFVSAPMAMAVDRDPDMWPSPNFLPGLSSIDANALMWNPITQQIEPAAADVNYNGSWGTTPGTCGPEVPVIARAKFRYSDSETNSAKVLLFKFTVPGSSINADVPDASATWDPSLSARPQIVGTFTVSPQSGGGLPQRGRFTGAAGTFDPAVWVITKSTTVAGSALGSLGFAGNNTLPYRVARVVAAAGDGSWVEIEGPFVAEGPRTYTLSAGPPPIYPELRQQWASMVSRCRDHGYVPVPVWLLYDQGESDLSHVEAYQTKLAQLFAAFDQLFGLRIKGQPGLPAVIALTTTETSWTVGNETIEEGNARIAQMRAAQAAVAAARTAAGAVSTTIETRDLPMELLGNNVVRTSRLHNGVHRTGRGLILEGFRFDRALFQIGAAPPHPKGEADAVDFGAVNGGTDSGSAEGGGSEDAPGGDSEGAGTDGPEEGVYEPTPEQADELQQALFSSPDVKRYRTPSGLEVERFAAADTIARAEYARQLAARRARINQTHVRFD